MRVQQIKCNVQTFRQNWREFCPDNEELQQIRKDIRECFSPYAEAEILYSGRLSDYELNQLIKRLVLDKPKPKSSVQKSTEVDEELLETAGFFNFEDLYDGNNSYRAGLNELTPEQIQIIKQAGIKHIIDLRESGGNIKCEGIEYLYFPYLQFDMVYNMSERNKLRYNREFVKFIQTMQKGNVLIGCEFGKDNTDRALRLNYFFNPKAKIQRPLRDKYFGGTMRDIYENLSQKDKKAMGWDEEFDKNFLNRLEKCGYWI